MSSQLVQKYQIKDLEKISGVKAHTLRMWEQRYNLFSPERTDTNIRFYTDNDLKKLLNIVGLINKGHKIGEFKNASDAEIADKVKSAELFFPNFESYLVAMLNFDIDFFNRLIDDSIKKWGFDKTIEDVLYPLLQKVGYYWVTNAITPVHEHFVSNIIRQKFFKFIDDLNVVNESPKTFLLFLPPDEYHEISILYAYYKIKKEGHKAVYLGQSVPTEDLIKAIVTIAPEYLVCFFVSQISGEEIINYLKKVFVKCHCMHVLAGGYQIETNKLYENKIQNILFLKKPDDLVEFLKN
jgi:MerR family transcriptional regulator, light-induced transcriptional regulator